MRTVLLITALFLLPSGANVAGAGYLYNAKFVQAAPGKLLALIDHYKSRLSGYSAVGDEAPMWIRHSQGDKWDLMLLFPMGSYDEYYQADRVARRQKAERASEETFRELVGWQEDLFVYGPALAELRNAFSKALLVHLEIFQSLPGKQADLNKERVMENAYQRSRDTKSDRARGKARRRFALLRLRFAQASARTSGGVPHHCVVVKRFSCDRRSRGSVVNRPLERTSESDVESGD